MNCHKCGAPPTTPERYFDSKPVCRACWKILIDEEAERRKNMRCTRCGGEVRRVDALWVRCDACNMDTLDF